MPASNENIKKKHDNKMTASPDEMLTLRIEIGHTQQEAADFLYVKKRTYQNWEYGISRAPLAFYEFYQLKAIARGLLKAKAERTEQDG